MSARVVAFSGEAVTGESATCAASTIVDQPVADLASEEVEVLTILGAGSDLIGMMQRVLTCLSGVARQWVSKSSLLIWLNELFALCQLGQCPDTG